MRETIDSASPARRILSVRRSSAVAAASRLGPAERRIVADFLDDIARGEQKDIDALSADEEASRTT